MLPASVDCSPANQKRKSELLPTEKQNKKKAKIHFSSICSFRSHPSGSLHARDAAAATAQGAVRLSRLPGGRRRWRRSESSSCCARSWFPRWNRCEKILNLDLSLDHILLCAHGHPRREAGPSAAGPASPLRRHAPGSDRRGQRERRGGEMRRGKRRKRFKKLNFLLSK